jgi:hypothetical protein
MTDELDFAGWQLFVFAQKQVSPGLKIKMETLHQSRSVRRREMRQQVQTEDAIEFTEEGWLYQIHTRKCDQIT